MQECVNGYEKREAGSPEPKAHGAKQMALIEVRMPMVKPEIRK